MPAETPCETSIGKWQMHVFSSPGQVGYSAYNNVYTTSGQPKPDQVSPCVFSMWGLVYTIGTLPGWRVGVVHAVPMYLMYCRCPLVASFMRLLPGL